MTSKQGNQGAVDFNCLSPDGRYGLTLTTDAPVAGEPSRAPLAWLARHEFTLSDRTADTVLWTLARRCSTPRQTWVSSRGEAAVLTGDDELFFVAPEGKPTGETSVLEHLEDDPEFSQHAESDSNGLLWDEAPIGYFFDFDGRSVFCLRPHWGTSLGFDVSDARPLEWDGSLVEAAGRAENQWVHARLQAGLDRIRHRNGCSPGSAIDIGLASELAWREGITSAVPLLKSLETACGQPGKSAQTPALSTGLADPSLFHPCSTRRAAQEALLRLGTRPEGRPVYATVSRDETTLPAHPRPVDWEDAMKDIRPGMDPGEVLRRVGTPFFADVIPGASAIGDDVPPTSAWEYDVLGQDLKPLTVRITCKSEVVDTVERLIPAPWLADDYRTRRLHREGVSLCMTGFFAGDFGPA